MNTFNRMILIQYSVASALFVFGTLTYLLNGKLAPGVLMVGLLMMAVASLLKELRASLERDEVKKDWMLEQRSQRLYRRCNRYEGLLKQCARSLQTGTLHESIHRVIAEEKAHTVAGE